MKTDRLESLQIGHSHTKDEDFKIKCEVINDKNVEVSFHIGISFMPYTGYTKEMERMS